MDHSPHEPVADPEANIGERGVLEVRRAEWGGYGGLVGERGPPSKNWKK